MDFEIENFINIMHRVFHDNAAMKHYARFRDRPRSTMPVTSFVYNFFIYNSIYQFDWEYSMRQGRLVHWDEKSQDDSPPQADQALQPLKEAQKQHELEVFMREICKSKTDLLSQALCPLGKLEDLRGSWTHVSDGSRITSSDGQRFFHHIFELSDTVRRESDGADGIVQPSKRNFNLIKECRFYINRVRNNIFHGSKSLGQIWDQSQKQRLAHYDLFLKCLVNLFFLCHERKALSSHCLELYTHTPQRTRDSGINTLTSEFQR